MINQLKLQNPLYIENMESTQIFSSDSKNQVGIFNEEFFENIFNKIKDELINNNLSILDFKEGVTKDNIVLFLFELTDKTSNQLKLNIRNKELVSYIFIKFISNSINSITDKYCNEVKLSKKNDLELPLLSGSLANQDNFSFSDYIISRILYSIAMLFEEFQKELFQDFKMDGSEFLKKIYENIIFQGIECYPNHLKNISSSESSLSIKLKILINEKEYSEEEMNIGNSLIAGRLVSDSCKIKLFDPINPNGRNYCSRIHFLIFFFNDIKGNPTISIVDPGSRIGIFKKMNEFLIQEQVFYMNVENDNSISIIAGTIPVKIEINKISLI